MLGLPRSTHISKNVSKILKVSHEISEDHSLKANPIIGTPCGKLMRLDSRQRNPFSGNHPKSAVRHSPGYLISQARYALQKGSRLA